MRYDDAELSGNKLTEMFIVVVKSSKKDDGVLCISVSKGKIDDFKRWARGGIFSKEDGLNSGVVLTGIVSSEYTI